MKSYMELEMAVRYKEGLELEYQCDRGLKEIRIVFGWKWGKNKIVPGIIYLHLSIFFGQ